MSHPDRPAPYPSEHENQKPGEPPRPATEPGGSEGSSDNPHTQTDPATGAPSGEQGTHKAAED